MIRIDWNRQSRFMKYYFLFGCALIAFTSVLAVVFDPLSRAEPMASQAQWSDITIGDKQLHLEIVSSPHDIMQGLGDRDQIPLDQGMLFVFSNPAPYDFWMRHMRFPLDIIWLRNGKIVDIAYQLPPPQFAWDIPVTHKPTEAADEVLEVVAGQANAYGLQVGGEIKALTEPLNYVKP